MDSSHTVNWDKVTEDDSINYSDYVRNHLPDIPEELVSCCNPNCSTHTTDLNAVCLQLLSCLEEGAIQCLPMIQSRRPAVPGWNIHARSLQKTAKFWHKLWSECGCPSSGIMFQLKKNSKSRYKYEVRRLKRQQQYIKSEMMGRALTQSRSRDFWKEVRKMSKSAKGRKATAPVIDNQSTDDDISNLFSTQLKGVLNSANNSVNRF